MGGHVKEKEILFLCRTNTFLHQILCQSLTNVSQLVLQLCWDPGLPWQGKSKIKSAAFSESKGNMLMDFPLTTKVFNPSLDSFWGIGVLDVLEGLVEENISSGGGALHNHPAIHETSSPIPTLLQFNSVPYSKFYQDATSKPRTDAVVPEWCVALTNTTIKPFHSV